MSLVVAYKRNGTVYMGADTQSTGDTEIERVLNESGFKISRLPSGMLVGFCGRVKGHQRVMAHKQLFDVPDGETFDKRYIVKNVIPRLAALMKEISDDNEARNASPSVKVIIAFKDKMWLIGSKYRVYECDSYVATGAGSEYARYPLSTIDESADVNEGLLKALRAGAHFDSTVSAPYILIDTRDREYRIAEE